MEHPTHTAPPTLLAAAHGTRSAAGVATLRSLAGLVRRLRPGLQVRLCFLDVLEPSLRTSLVDAGPATVVVPALLSTGYHVVHDIPAVVAGRVPVAAHLGPDPRITAALVDRLAEAGAPGSGTVALVGAGSTHPAAQDELATAGTDLAGALGRPVHPMTVADEVPAGVTAVATYLLAEGFFAAQVRARAAAGGVDVVSAPLGDHPAIGELILARYNAAARW